MKLLRTALLLLAAALMLSACGSKTSLVPQPEAGFNIQSQPFMPGQGIG